MYVTLTIAKAGEGAMTYGFPVDQHPVHLGSAKDCNIVLEGAEVGPRHLKIMAYDGAILLESTAVGGVFVSVQDEPLVQGQTVAVKPRDSVRLRIADYFLELDVYSAGSSKWESFRTPRVLGPTEAPSPHSVDFGLFGPQRLVAGSQSTLDVWAFRDEHRTWVAEQAAKVQRDRVIGIKTGVELKPGTAIDISLALEEADVPFPRETMIWSGEATNASFVVKVPEDVGGSLAGRVDISVDGIPIGSIQFVLRVAEEEDLSTREYSGDGWAPIRSAFASYASTDRAEVFARLQGIKAVAPDIEVFVDVLSLRAGDEWKEKLVSTIRDSQAFLLFWSKAAAASPWVKLECRVALHTRGLKNIKPVPLEDPRNVPPPEELSALHFNDAFLAHIDYERRNAPSTANAGA